VARHGEGEHDSDPRGQKRKPATTACGADGDVLEPGDGGGVTLEMMLKSTTTNTVKLPWPVPIPIAPGAHAAANVTSRSRAQSTPVLPPTATMAGRPREAAEVPTSDWRADTSVSAAELHSTRSVHDQAVVEPALTGDDQ
jgi:hypothetical protein